MLKNVVVSFILICLISVISFAEVSYELEGWVKYQNKESASGVTMSIGNDYITTDKNGYYRFTFLRPGEHVIFIGHPERTLQTVKVIIKNNYPYYVDAHYNLGVVYGESGNLTEAIESYKQAIRIDPDDALAHYNLGVAYGELGRLAEAIESYQQAIRIDPDDVDAYINLGVAYGESGNLTEAIESYKQAIRIDPDDALAYINLGVAYGELGKLTEAKESYQQAIRIDPDQIDNNSNIWHIEVGQLGQLLDNSRSSIAITSEGNNLYQMRRGGEILRYSGRDWEQLDDNPDDDNPDNDNYGILFHIHNNNNILYKILRNGEIQKYNPDTETWERLEHDPTLFAFFTKSNIVRKDFLIDW